MEQTLAALGGLLLRALPTFFLVVFLFFYLRAFFFKPLEKVLQARYDATEGARQTAEASLARASGKAAEFEAALRAARAEMYQEQEQLRRQLQDERAAAVREAREEAQAAVNTAKAALAADVEAARKTLAAESEELAERITAAVLGRRAA